MLRPLTGHARDSALAVARILLGIVLCAHGAQKLFSYGFAGTTAAFAKIGVPLPAVSAAYASVVELVGGGLLILGVATTIVSALVVVDMIGASLTTGSYASVFVESHGFELEASLLAGALLLLVAGAGRYSVDHLLLARREAATAPTTA
jgi:putative oxidoreductase